MGCSADGVRWATSRARAGLAGGRGGGRGARAGSGVCSAGERGREDEGEDEAGGGEEERWQGEGGPCPRANPTARGRALLLPTGFSTASGN